MSIQDVGRDWAWELQAAGHGPDHFFIASVAPSDAQQLARLVRAHLLPGFRRDAAVLPEQHRCTYHDMYVDDSTYEQLAANRASSQPANIWFYTRIEVCDHQLTIERGYGRDGLPAETSLMLAVARSTQVMLVEWRIMAGGQGYDSVTIAGGTTQTELVDYLNATS